MIYAFYNLLFQLSFLKIIINLENVFIEKISINNANECYQLDLKTIGLWNLQQWEEELKKKYVYAFACIKDYKMIGICVSQIIFSNAELTYFSIHPTFKRKGLGTKLFKEILKEFKMFAIEKIILEVSDKNQAALNFYDSFGFETVSIRERYYKDGSNALLQEKKLLKK